MRGHCARLVLGLLSAAAAAEASVETDVGLGPRGVARAGSRAARPGSYDAVFYNPAGLAPGGATSEQGGHLELELGALYGRPVVHATRADGTPLPAATTPDLAGAVLGMRFSVGQPFGVDGLDAGVAVWLPSRLFRWNIVPDDDPHWWLLTDRHQVVSAHFGLGWRIDRWLSVGAALRVGFDVETFTRGEVTDVTVGPDPQSGKNVIRAGTQFGTDATVYGTVSPLFGVLLTPVDQLRIGLVYRHRSVVDDWGETRASGVPGLGNLGYGHRFTHYFEPSSFTAAVSADLAPGLEVSVDVTLHRYGDATTTNMDFFGPGRFGDTLSPAAGVSYRTSAATSLLLGYRFAPSPVDNLGGPTNLLDNDRHNIGLGSELRLAPLLGAPALDAKLVFGVQHQVFVERSEHKDFRRFTDDEALEGNPGYPSYRHGGHLLVGTVGLEARW